MGLILGCILGEFLARRSQPPPRINVVQPREGLSLLEDEGGHVYWQDEAPARRNATCEDDRGAEGAARIALFGSSITYGSGVEADEAFSAGLSRLRPAWCVHNYGEPAFGYEAKRAAARAALPALKPELVLWEIWINDNARYVRAGDLVYDPADLLRDEAGYPTWLPLPAGLHGWLFQRSRFYAYASIARAPGGYTAGPSIWSEYEDGELDALKGMVEDAGGELVLSIWPRLDRSFEASVDEPPSVYRVVERWAEATGTPLIDVAALLVGEDHEALRADPCCHYNPVGHGVIAERLVPVLDGFVE